MTWGSNYQQTQEGVQKPLILQIERKAPKKTPERWNLTLEIDNSALENKYF